MSFLTLTFTLLEEIQNWVVCSEEGEGFVLMKIIKLYLNLNDTTPREQRINYNNLAHDIIEN